MLLTHSILLASLATPLPLPQDPLVETRRMLPAFGAPNLGSRCAAVGDVDGDGIPDIVFGKSGADVLARGAGSGWFDAAEPIPTGAQSLDVKLADFDGDGDLDAFFLQQDGGSPVFDGQGGTLVFGYDVAGASSDAGSCAIGDVDLDGDVDVVLAVRGGSDQLLRNQGGVLVLDAGALVSPSDLSLDVELADLDGDGDLDAAFAVYQSGPLEATNRVLSNDGSGAFALLAGADLGTDGIGLDLADTDGDGDVDACLSGASTTLFANPGTALFATPGLQVTGASNDNLLDDFNGDGLVDVLAFGDGIELHAALSSGGYVDVSASALPATVDVLRAVTADLDGDLDVDALVLHEYTPANLWLNGGGVFAELQTALPYRTVSQTDVAIGDVNGDGAPDLYIADSADSNSLYLGDGTGQWTDASAGLPVTNGSRAVALADFDGDGDEDALCGRAGKALLSLNDGVGGMTPLAGAMPDGTTNAADFAHGDLDGDGDLDLLLTRSVLFAWDLFVLENDGTAVFTTSALFGGSGVSDTPRLFDADADGDLDVMLPSTGGTRFFLGDGAGGLAQAPGDLPSLGTSYAVAIGDVDLDGDPDVAVALAGPNQLWLNSGGGFQADPNFNVLPSTRTIALGDIDGDGDPDIVAGDAATMPTGGLVATNDGAGNFSLAGSFSESTYADLELVDLDGDGDMDVLACDGNRTIQLTSVFGGQVARRTPARISKPLRMEVFGPAGAPWTLAASAGTASVPLPPFGTLLLDPSQLWILASGQVPAGGVASVDVPLGPDLSLLGLTFHWQALVGTPLAFTNREAATVTSL